MTVIIDRTRPAPKSAAGRARAKAEPGGGLYKPRVPIHPKLVHGRWRAIKWALLILTLAVYYITPWIRWERPGGLPDQAVLVDFAGRRFYFFNIQLWPQEVYFITGLLVIAALALFLVTALFGRLWCGYACPQTIWTDLFIHVERLFEGDRNARLRLDAAPWSFDKVWRKTGKHLVWLGVAFATGGAWIFYFHDAPTLLTAFWAGEGPFTAYFFCALLTATTYVFAGHMREQVCIYMCPWPRIQTAMLDEKSLIVTYKDWRGEPRGSVKKAAKAPEKFGDCIDCLQCVAVCPTGVDIREGQQIGCITCGLCIDACDKVMKDIGRPRGLIDYATLDQCKAEAAGAPAQPAWKSLLRLRLFLYFGVWAAIGAGLLFALGTRTHTELTVSPDRNPPFMLMKDGSVRNAYTLRLRNMEARPRELEVALEGLPKGAVMWTESISLENAAPAQVIAVPANETKVMRAYVMLPPGQDDDDSLHFNFRLTSRDEQRESDVVEATFAMPEDD